MAKKETVVAKATRERKADRSVVVADGSVSICVTYKDGDKEMVQIPESLVLEFAGRGINALVGDIFAKVKTAEDAKVAVGQAFHAVSQGNLPVRVRSSAPKIHPVVAAIAHVNNVPYEKAAAWYAGQDCSDKAKARADSRVKAHLAELKGKTVKAPPVHSFDGLADSL